MGIGRGSSSAAVLVATLAAGLAFAETQVASQATSAGKGDRELGEYLASQCTGCHQVSGKASGGIPSIVGWPEDQFVAVIRSYKEGVRDNETMRTISHRFNNEEIAALAAFFGSLPASR